MVELYVAWVAVLCCLTIVVRAHIRKYKYRFVIGPSFIRVFSWLVVWFTYYVLLIWKERSMFAHFHMHTLI